MDRRDPRDERPTLLHELVEARVRSHPSAIAVVDARRAFTYGELDRRASDLADGLRRLGVGLEVPVALCCGRSADMAAAFLAILKAGGTCVPLDPDHPAERLRFVIDDVDVAVVLVDDRRLEAVLRSPRRLIVPLDRAWDGHEGGAAMPPLPVTADSLAYVLYTSGSTGNPKGVALTHAGLVNHAVAMSRIFELSPEDRMLQFASIAFDLSFEELFASWAAGAAVVLRPPDVPVLGREWRRWLGDAAITVMDLPTGYWERWVHDLSVTGQQVPDRLRLLVVGGEQPSPAAYATWLAVGGAGVRWLNTYGPTEASVVATWYEPPRRPVDRLPIGRPIPNTTAHVLDAQMSRVPPGGVGELYLGGVGVARGYVHDRRLTADRFVPDPFSDSSGARLFKTRDLVRRRHDGDLEFLGRIDHQLKIRGVRVEPGEVESALVAHAGVRQAVVVGRQDPSGELRLVAYCVPEERLPSPSSLRAHLGARLPDQLVPSVFVAMEELPLTINGKLDAAALPRPPSCRPPLGTPLVRPRTETEFLLAGVWTEVLELEEVSVQDDFFDLGGHSFLALQAVFLAQQRLGIDLPTNAVIQSPTVESLARLADSARLAGVAPLPPVVARERDTVLQAPLSLQQQWMWALETNADPPGLYNITVHQRLTGPANLDALKAALAHLVARHEALRTVFCPRGEDVSAAVLPTAEVDLDPCDLTSLSPEAGEVEFQRRLADQNRESFCLSSGPLFRARYYQLDGDRHEVALTCDHLVADGVSVGILLHELRECYRAFSEGRKPALRPLAVQYADYATWQRQWITDAQLQQETAYWVRKLAGMPLGPGIPFDREPSAPDRRVRRHHLEVLDTTYHQLVRLAHDSSCSLFPVCVAAVQALIARSSGRSDVVVSTMLSGRQRRELEGVVGLFAGVVRLRTDVSGDPTFRSLLRRARDTALEAFEHQNVPFGRVRRALLADGQYLGDARAQARDLPVDVQYFPSDWDLWRPGSTVMARHPRYGADEQYYGRGQRHPLMVDVFNDRREMWITLSYKAAFYDDCSIKALATQLGAFLDAVSLRPDDRITPILEAL